MKYIRENLRYKKEHNNHKKDLILDGKYPHPTTRKSKKK